jgi:hypothetical protein
MRLSCYAGPSEELEDETFKKLSELSLEEELKPSLEELEE